VDSVHLEGQQLIPPGPKIIVANHANVSDAFILPFIIREKIHFFIQEETFTLPILGKLLSLADQVPVVIGQGRQALDTAIEKLQQGHAVGVFPEGRLNHGKELRRAGTGATILALESGAPLVPMGFYVPPKFTKLLKTHAHNRMAVGSWQIRGRCYVNVGQPWLPALPEKVESNYRVLRQITDNLMDQINDLVQQAKDNAHI
jgi:1-acyl-sn-glycerol-3-phosphate acyltransferase